MLKSKWARLAAVGFISIGVLGACAEEEPVEEEEVLEEEVVE